MSQLNKYFAGEDVQGLFIGVVESRQDPLQLGRVQVRVFGVHNPSLTEIPSADLPWATIIQGMNGKAFSTPKESDVVVGFWLDGSKQLPCVWGVIPGIETNPPNLGSGFHDLRSNTTISYAPKVPVSRTYATDGSGIIIKEANTADPAVLETLRHPNADELNQPSIPGIARYHLANTVIQARKDNLDKNIQSANQQSWSEPYPAYNPEYPYDNATVTESGHVFELDDTPGSERINITHRTGSYKEWFPSGSVVEKVTRSNYQVVMADDYLHVMGRVLVTVDGDALIRVKGDTILEGGGHLSANIAGDVDFSVGGGFNVAANSINLVAENDASMIGDTIHITAQDEADLLADTLYMTGSSEADLTGGDININSDGDTNILAGGDLNLQGDDVNLSSDGDLSLGGGGGLNLSAGGTAALGGGTVGISGTVYIDGLQSVNQGAPGPGGAGGASGGTGGSPGEAVGLPAAIAPLKKNTARAHPEDVPVPFNIKNVALDPVTGVAYKQSQFLQPTGSGPPGTGAGTTKTPDSNTAANTADCSFDASSANFLTDPSTWAISQQGLSLIQSAEGFAKVTGPDTCTAYPDPGTGGQPYTIGYGSTAVAIGQPVTLGEMISRETAQNFLVQAINTQFLPVLKSSITAPITQNQLDACLSLIYNIGPSNWLKSSVLKNINSQNYCAAGNAFNLWNKAGGNVLPGLTTRRAQERALFIT